jgi:ribosomal protein L11 methylase PrmA
VSTRDDGMRIELPSGLVIQTSPFFPWKRGGTDLKIECGSAFHPRHVTSKLCLRLLDGFLPSLACNHFLDVGCGSGILALAALRLGAVWAVGLDIDPRAIRIARRNAISNCLGNRAEWVLGASSAVRGRFDCVAANLPFPILLHHLDELTSAVQPNGILVVSGFHDIEEGPLRRMLAEKGFMVERSIKGDLSYPELPPFCSPTWVGMVGRRVSAQMNFTASSV